MSAETPTAVAARAMFPTAPERHREVIEEVARQTLTAALDAVDLAAIAEQALIDHARQSLDMSVGECIEAKVRAALLGTT